MIQQESVLAVAELARMAAEQGKTIVAQPNTPLSTLCTNSSLTGAPVVTSMEDIDTAPAAIAEASNNIVHNDQFDHFAKIIVESAYGHLSFAQNVVKSAIITTAQRVMKDLGAIDKSPVQEFEIVVSNLPRPLQIETFAEAVKNETTSDLPEPQKMLKLPSKGPQELLELMKSGTALFDDEVTAWFNVKGDTFFVQLWENLFMSATEAFPERTYRMPEILGDLDDGADAAVAIILIARKLAANAPAEAKMSGDDFAFSLMQYRQIAARRLHSVIAEYQTAEVQNILIKSKNSLKKKIAVYGRVYLQWIKDGGRNEILFGSLIQNSVAVTTTSVNAEKAKLLSAWDTFKNVTLTRYQNDQHVRFVSVLRTSFYQDLSTAVEEERAYKEEHGGHLDKVNKLLEGALRNVKLSDKSDIYRTVMKLICECRFYYTDAYKLFCAIDEATLLNPDLDIKDAETIATFEYITDYVAAQLRVM